MTHYERNTTDEQRSLTFNANLPRDANGQRAGQAVVNELYACESALAAARQRVEELERFKAEALDETARFNRGFERRNESYSAVENDDDEFQLMGWAWANANDLCRERDALRAEVEELKRERDVFEGIVERRLEQYRIDGHEREADCCARLMDELKRGVIRQERAT